MSIKREPEPDNFRSTVVKEEETVGSALTSAPPKLYHTLTACTRCRSRKTRCDAGLPRCGPCERSGSHCEFYDSTKGKTLPRNYVIHLQAKVRRLEEEIARRQALLSEIEEPDCDELVREIGMVSLSDDTDPAQKAEPRFVGTSSGINMTRLILDFTKKNIEPEAIREIVEGHRSSAKQQPEKSQQQAQQTYTSGVQPAFYFPARDMTDKLIDTFMEQAQILLPILHEPTFRQYVDDIYNGDRDPVKMFQLRMVLATALQRFGPESVAHAEQYYLAAYAQIEEIMEPKDLLTLQCVALLCQYSIQTPTKIAIYHILGIAVRLCIQLGYSQEKTILLGDPPPDPLTEDLRRRIFWTIASFEYGVSHILGRPSGFATVDAYIDVKFYQPVEDKYITREGVVEGAPPCLMKLISMHFFRLRRLQAQIRQTLYQNPRPSPRDDRDPWFQEMKAKVEKWMSDAPGGRKSGITRDWFMHRYNNLIIFMYRPSPQIPKPSLDATLKCFDAAVKNIYLEKKMFEAGTSSSFVFAYQITIALMAILWGITCEKIRELHSKEVVKKHIDTALTILKALAIKWPGTAASVDIIGQLSKAAFKSYDVDERARSEKSNSLSPPPLNKSIHRTSQSPIRNLNGQTPVERTSKATPPPPPPPSLPPPAPSATPRARQSRALSNTSNASSHHRASYHEQSPFHNDNTQPELKFGPDSTPSPGNTGATASIASAASPTRMFEASPSRSGTGYAVDIHHTQHYTDSASPASDYQGQDINTILQDPRAIHNIFSEGLDLTSWDPLQMYPIGPNTMTSAPNGGMSDLPPQSHFPQGYSMNTSHATSQFGSGMHPETSSMLEHQAQQMELMRILEQEQMHNYQQQQQNNGPVNGANGDGGLFRNFYFN